jgi:hypothetical protein
MRRGSCAHGVRMWIRGYVWRCRRCEQLVGCCEAGVLGLQDAENNFVVVLVCFFGASIRAAVSIGRHMLTIRVMVV